MQVHRSELDVDIQPKRTCARLVGCRLVELQEHRAPILITEHGRPAAYLVDVESFDTQQSRIQILEGIARGEKAVQDGRILTHEQAKKRMKRWLA